MPRVDQKRVLQAVGITSGIGSMLVGARQAGFQVVGNIEWRKYYHHRDSEGRNTFTENFPGAFMKYRVDDLTSRELSLASGCDLAIGHPECGNFSVLSGSRKNRLEMLNDPCDIPLFVDLIAQLQPRFFVMDDLPKSFGPFPIEKYWEKLPGYDLFPEWVSNWGYGNVQKFRNRMFMVGARKEEKWAFTPGETKQCLTVRQAIRDLGEPGDGTPNHDSHENNSCPGRFANMPQFGDKLTWKQFAEYIRDLPEGKDFRYQRADGVVKVRIGSCKVRWDGPSPVLSGGNPHFHPLRCYPLTVRERARIQGFPDDFIFYGTKLNDQGEWTYDRNVHMIKQTGKAMPVEFCRYVSVVIAAAINNVPFESSGARILKPNPHVDTAKKWFCDNVGYADQERACGVCWLKDHCEIRVRKYGLGVLLTQPVNQPVKKIKARTTTPLVQAAEATSAVSKVASVKSGSKSLGGQPILIRPIDIEVLSNPGGTRSDGLEPVCCYPGGIPGDYHCQCEYCLQSIGELRRPDGSYYSRLERRGYYDPSEKGKKGGGHIAKTPLHIARWAVQQYTCKGDWVLDPTAGSGTTLVESLIQGRNAAGVELEYGDILRKNVSRHVDGLTMAVIGLGDARGLRSFLSKSELPPGQLVINNPPYSGDVSVRETWDKVKGMGLTEDQSKYLYDKSLPNLAFLRENDEYWSTLKSIYRVAVDWLSPGGHFVVGVKDMMREKKPFLLHRDLCLLLSSLEPLEFVGMSFLRHYPLTLHLNTYKKFHGVDPPLYQTIIVFRKGGEA